MMLREPGILGGFWDMSRERERARVLCTVRFCIL